MWGNTLRIRTFAGRSSATRRVDDWRYRDGAIDLAGTNDRVRRRVDARPHLSEPRGAPASKAT